MARNFFLMRRGAEVDNITWIVTAGPPGGSGDADLVPLGSYAVDKNNGKFYQKSTAGTGADKWEELVNLRIVRENDSWRQPARVKDDSAYANLAAAEAVLNDITTPGNIGGVDSDQFVDGDRILYTNITGENKNIFTVNGTPGSAATLVEDVRAPQVVGDVVLITDGFSAGRFFQYDTAGDWSTQDDISDVIDAVNRAHFEFVVTGISTPSVVDNPLVDVAAGVKWMLVVENEGARTEKLWLRVDAVHDGYNAAGGADAANVDYNVFSELDDLGLDDDDVEIDVTLTGTGATQRLQLVVDPDSITVTVYGVREIVPFEANNPA